MSFARGERVYFDLDEASLNGNAEAKEASVPATTTASAFFGDILERDSSTTNPPLAPTLKANTTGFPAHKRRAPKVSAFRQQRAAQKGHTANAPSSQPLPTKAQGNGAYTDYKHRPLGMSPEEDEQILINQENNERLASMSQAEIEQAQQELLSTLSPSLIQRLLNRSTIDEGSNESELMPQAAIPPTDESRPASVPTNKKVTFKASDADPHEATPQDAESRALDVSLRDETPDLDQLSPSVHFPKPLSTTELDPNSDTFLQDMHEKYFPDLPYDPSSVSWMQPIDPSDTSSPYHPSQAAFNPSELRFDFKGALLAPSTARDIPTTEGLHHHGEAPEAAGYTVPELAHLSRSAVAAQRCIAYRTLGRILYRLGTGEFGVEEPIQRVEGPVGIVKDPNQMGEDEQEEWEEESVGSAMAKGLWDCIEEGRVIETLTEESGRERGHLTARTYAQEALWNWRRGGGRKRRAV